MAAHRTGYSVERVITIAYLRDPRVIGIIEATLYGTLTRIGIDMTEVEAYAHARDIRDGMYADDVVDGEHQCLGGEA